MCFHKTFYISFTKNVASSIFLWKNQHLNQLPLICSEVSMKGQDGFNLSESE